MHLVGQPFDRNTFHYHQQFNSCYLSQKQTASCHGFYEKTRYNVFLFVSYYILTSIFTIYFQRTWTWLVEGEVQLRYQWVIDKSLYRICFYFKKMYDIYLLIFIVKLSIHLDIFKWSLVRPGNNRYVFDEMSQQII